MLHDLTIQNHLLLLIFIALLIRGWHIVTRPGMLLDFVGKKVLYIQEEETLRAMPETLRSEKLLALMAFEAGLESINAQPDKAPSEDEAPKALDAFEECLVELKTECSPHCTESKTESKLTLLNEFELYMQQANAAYEVNYAHAAAQYKQKAPAQAWKKWVGKPLGNCPVCASSVFGITGQLVAYAPILPQLSGVYVLVFLVSLPVIAGIQYAIT